MWSVADLNVDTACELLSNISLRSPQREDVKRAEKSEKVLTESGILDICTRCH